MADIGPIRRVNGNVSGWIVEIAGGSSIFQGTYSMFEVDPLTCAFERPGGPSFELSAEDVARYEKVGLLQVVGPFATNDNRDAETGAGETP